MPNYRYKCGTCDIVTNIRHSIADTSTKNCLKCNGSLERVPSINVTSDRVKKINNEIAEVGKLTRQSIKEFREALKQDRKELLEKSQDGVV